MDDMKNALATTAATEDDVKNFISSLKKERQPDLTVVTGDYRWKVHSHVLSGTSAFLQKLCSSENEEAKARELTLHSDEPTVVGHLVLWWYTGEYSGVGSDGSDGEESLTIQMIMENGRHQSPTTSDMFVSASEPEPEYGAEPAALHAKMYLLADKYGITDLTRLAVAEIETRLDWDKASLLPILTHLLTTAQETTNESVTRVISEEQDTNLWNILAETASTKFLTHRDDAGFSQVMLQNPKFQWDVLRRVAKNMETVEAKLATATAIIEVPKLRKGSQKRKKNVKEEDENQTTPPAKKTPPPKKA